jgi:hypothetical protein
MGLLIQEKSVILNTLPTKEKELVVLPVNSLPPLLPVETDNETLEKLAIIVPKT